MVIWSVWRVRIPETVVNVAEISNEWISTSSWFVKNLEETQVYICTMDTVPNVIKRLLTMLYIQHLWTTKSDVLFTKTAPFAPMRGHKIAEIDIMDEMHFEMDITIHTFPYSSWQSIFQCIGTSTSNRLPHVFLHYTSDNNGGEYEGFQVRLTTEAGEIGPRSTKHLNDEETYHLDIDFTQTWLRVKVDGETVYYSYNAEYGAHPTFESASCYASAPSCCGSLTSWSAADVTISNILITSGIITYDYK